MGRGWKILIGVVAVLAVLLAVNTLVVEGETKSAEVTVPGGRILELAGRRHAGRRRGPARRQPDRPASTASPARSTGGTGCSRRSNASTASSPSTCSASAAPKSRAPATRSTDQAALVAEALRAARRRTTRRSSATRWAAPWPPPRRTLAGAGRTARDHRPGARTTTLREGGPAPHRQAHLPAGDRPGALAGHPGLRDQGRPRGRLRARLRRARRLRRRLQAADLHSYDESPAAEDDYVDEMPLDRGSRMAGRPAAPAAGDLRRRGADLRPGEGAGRLRRRCPAPRPS